VAGELIVVDFVIICIKVYNLAVKYGLTDCHICSGFLLIVFVREAVKLLVVVVEGSFVAHHILVVGLLFGVRLKWVLLTLS
jgi:hypothetical protein